MSQKINDAIDFLFDILGDNTGNVLKWLYGNNTALGGVPVDLIKNGRIEEVYNYLHFQRYGPY
jgi:hypothetical protein